MMVLAPGRLSMMTGWPQASVIFCPIRRDTRSLGPPAGNGTTIWIGRLGKDDASGPWAAAPESASVPASAPVSAIIASWACRFVTISPQRRHVVGDRHPPEQAAHIGGKTGARGVGAAVVPDQDVADPPSVLIDQLAVLDMVAQLVDQGAA